MRSRSLITSTMPACRPTIPTAMCPTASRSIAKTCITQPRPPPTTTPSPPSPSPSTNGWPKTPASCSTRAPATTTIGSSYTIIQTTPPNWPAIISPTTSTTHCSIKSQPAIASPHTVSCSYGPTANPAPTTRTALTCTSTSSSTKTVKRSGSSLLTAALLTL